MKLKLPLLLALLAVLLLVGTSYANTAYQIPAYVYDPAAARFVKTAQMSSTFMSPQAVSVGTFVKDAATVKQYATLSTIPEAAGIALVDSVSSGSSKLILKRGVGIVSGVGTVVTLALLAKDVYDWSQQSETNKAYFQGVSDIEDFGGPLQLGEVGYLPGSYSGYYRVDSTVGIPGTYHSSYGPVSPMSSCTAYNSSTQSCTEMVVYTDLGNMNYSFQYYKITPTTKPASSNAAGGTFDYFSSQVDAHINAAPGADPYPNMNLGIDAAMRDLAGKTQMYPTPQDLSDLDHRIAADTAAQNAQQATSSLVQNLQDAYARAQAAYQAGLITQLQLDQVKADLDRAIADKAKEEREAAEEAVEEDKAKPGEVPANVYDSSVDLPEKKGIQGLIESFIESSPVAALIKSFSFDLDAGTCKQYMFSAYGLDYDFDLCPYTSQIAMIGTIILAFSHVSAIFILFRKGSGGE